MYFKQRIKDFIANLMTFTSNNKPTFVVALLYVCFTSLWESLFKIFIIPIISQFSSNWITTTILFFFVILIIFKTIQNWIDGKKPSDTLTGLSMFILSLWRYYRFPSTTAIHTIPYTEFCYVDIIPVICSAVIFLRCFPKSFKTLESNQNGFLTDSPINNSTDDILNRSIQAKDLVDKMLATDTTKEAFTLGIVAPWGEGKTSFIKLMQNHIPKEYISITFNPWIYRKKSNLTTLFFDELKNSIKPYSPTLASNINKYADLLSNVNNEWTQFSAYLLRISNEKTTSEQYQILKDNIRKLSRKIIVFIDDIDRLNSEEIEEILRLVRNGSNLPNMYFVLAYDKNYIIEALSKQFTTHSLSYTKKILQEEYVLPLASKKQKADILMAGLKDLLNNEEELKKLRDGVIGNYVSKINPMDYIHTLRDVKKVTNEFIFNYRNLHGEVNVVDFFIFELFKYHYPLVVDLLIRRKDDILINTGQSMCVYFDGHNAPNQTDPTRFYKKEYFNLIDYVKQHHEEFHLSNQDIQQVVCFMESLWGEFKSTEIGSINNPMYIDRYLNCNLLQSEVSEVEFNELLKLPFIEMKTKLSEWMVNKSGSLIYRLQNLYPDKKIEIYKLLHILFYVGCKSGYTHRLFNCINNQIASLLYIEGKTDIHSQEDLNEIWRCLTENPVNTFIRDYLFSHFENGKYEGIFPEKKITKLQSDLFSEYVNEGNHSVHDVIEWWYRTGTGKSSPQNENNGIHSLESTDLLKEYLRRKINEALKSFIGYEMFNKSNYICSYVVKDVWENYENFYQWINSIDNNSQELQEFKLFLKEYKENGYQPTKFQWQYVQLNQ